MTPEQEKRIRIRVGFFTLVGLLIIGSMVTYFGRLGEGIKKFYPIRVEYPNASGLLKGADVLMAGAKVGSVAEGPFIMEDGRGVFVGLKIYEGIPIPEGSTFTIGSSGLLGDRFVDITMKPVEKETKPELLKSGATVIGKRESGMSELASEGGLMLSDIREAVQKINQSAGRVNEHLLTEETLREFSQAVSNLNSTTESLTGSARQLDQILSDTSKKIDVLLADASEAVKEGKSAMSSASAAAGEIKVASGDLRKIVGDARKGKGIIGVLLNDEQAANNLRALIANLRKHGILWYKDRSEVQDSR